MSAATTDQDPPPPTRSAPPGSEMGRRAYDRRHGAGEHPQTDRKPEQPDAGDADHANDKGAQEENNSGKDADQEKDKHDGKDEKDGKDGEDGKNGKEKKSLLRAHPLLIAAAAILLLLLIIGSILYWLHARQYESTDDAYIDGHMVRLAPQVAGTVRQLLIDDNQTVVPNQLLAVIDTSQQRARYEGLVAQATQARSSAVQATAQVEVARQQVAAARAKVAEPEAALAKARADLARYRSLQKLEPTAVAGQQIDAANEAVRVAQAQRDAAARQVDQAQAQLKAAQTAIETSQAAFTAADAQVRAAGVDLTNSRITAPIAGRVANRNVALGSYVQPGQEIMAIVPTKLWITANFKETQLTFLRVGQPVDIKVDAFPNVGFTGHVESLQPGAGQAFSLLPAENATGNFVKVVQRVPVRISIDPPGFAAYPVGPGMSVVPRVKVR